MAMLVTLAIADDWTGWEHRIGDVPTTTDWLCDCAHQIEDWGTVNSILTRYVNGSLSIDEAREELDKVLR